MSETNAFKIINPFLTKELENIYRFLILNKGQTLTKLVELGRALNYSIKFSNKYKELIFKTKDSSFLLDYNYNLINVVFNKENDVDEHPISHYETIYDGTRIIASFKDGQINIRTSGSFSNCEYLNGKTKEYEKGKYDNDISLYDLFIKQCNIMKINLDELAKLSNQFPDKTLVVNFILILQNTPIPKGSDFQNTIILENAYLLNNTEHLKALKKLFVEREQLKDENMIESEFKLKKFEYQQKLLDIIDNNNLFDIKQAIIGEFNDYLKFHKFCDIITPTHYVYKDEEEIKSKLETLPYYSRGFKITYNDGSFKDIINPKYEELINLRIHHSICPNTIDADICKIKDIKDIKNIWRLFQKLVCEGKLQDFYKFYDSEEKYKFIFNFFMDKVDEFVEKLFSQYNYGTIYKKVSPDSKIIIKNSKPIPRPFRIIKKIEVQQLDPNKIFNQVIHDLFDYTHQEYKKHKKSNAESLFDTKFDVEYLKTNMIFNDFFKSDYENWQRNYVDSDFFFGDLYGKIITPIWE
jgi:hypothetical protein